MDAISRTAGDTVIVVPCYNEAGRLQPEAFRAFAASNASASFLLVDDGSTDRTRELLDALHRERPDRFAVLPLAKNFGKAEAVRRGLQLGLDAGKRYVGYWDADLATPLAAIGAFRDTMEARPHVEMLLGSRVKLLGRRIDRRAGRHYLGRVFATAASMTLRLGVYDTQCGAKMFRASETMRGVLEQPFESRWIFDVELIARFLQRHGWPDGPAELDPIQELPLETWVDVGGSKIRPADWLFAAVDLARIAVRYRAPLVPRNRVR
ncbi:MAG: hypothetical protein DHS20C21_02640 [Gemmatimonadota bacterium]|nr:MAG: hypothetical protein DHS20C21_02640 [Gemmatimonadota bacterium]